MAKPYKRGKIWWIAPMMDGVQRHQSAETTDYSEACKKLKILEGRLAHGEAITPKIGKVTVGELLDDSITEYKVSRKITDEKDENFLVKLRRVKCVRSYFGHMKAAQVKKADVLRYCEKRQAQKAKNSTINRELSELRHAFRLGYPEKVLSIPPIKDLEEGDNERSGYYSREELASVCAHLSRVLAALITVAYITGWRIGTVMNLEWREVDLKEGWVSCFQTKNKIFCRWPLVAGLREIFEEQRRVTSDIERQRGMIIPYVFHRNGRPIKSFYGAFDEAKRKAGLPGRVVHDFRGTATVNLLEAGVDLPKVMSMVGFKTVTMVNRYASKRGLRDKSLMEAGQMLENRIGITKSITVGDLSLIRPSK